jgi:hypothetical protein
VVFFHVICAVHQTLFCLTLHSTVSIERFRGLC